MLVSGGQGIMRIDVTYGVSRIARVVRFCSVRCCSFQAAFRSVVPLFPPSLPSLIGGLVLKIKQWNLEQ